MNKQDIGRINAIAELERIGWDFERISDDEIKLRCPAHSDATASATMNVSKKVWKCHGASCGAKGDIISFLSLALKQTRVVTWELLKKNYEFSGDKTIDPEVVERYHNALRSAKNLREELYARGLTDDDIRRWRLGENRGRITIPIRNDSGDIVNIRKYLPGAPGHLKMKNVRDRGEIRLYPIDQLKYDTIILCGGECKALAVASRLNDFGFGAIAPTAGEGNWHHTFSSRFKDKKVFICYDIDNAGKVAASKVAMHLKPVASWLGVIDLPLNADKYPTGDVNDFFGSEKKTAEDFLEVLKATDEWEMQSVEDEIEDSSFEEVEVNDVTVASHAGKRIRVSGTVAAIDQTPFLIPKEVAVACDRAQPNCMSCPVYALPSDPDKSYVSLTIKRDSRAILDMINVGERSQHDGIRKALRIPSCRVVTFNPRTHYNVEEARIVPTLDIRSNDSEERMVTAYSVSHGLQGNTAYVLEGRVWPSPRTQQAVFLVNDSSPAIDSLSEYNPKPEELKDLNVFRPSEWTVDGITKKLDEVYHDFEANVTRIYRRRDLHLAVDLVYHSALMFKFDGREVKGWAEALIIGDSAQGKSETSISMMNHYELGERVDAKNASIAGLLGGVQQLGNRWFVTWGRFPLSDRRLLILEELKGASVETIAALTDMRSSGIAEIQKIERRKTRARTRFIAISNPRSDLPISAYNYGLEAIRELIGGPEDVRRFDFALLVCASEVDAGELNKLAMQRPQVRHEFTKDLCRKLILWTWTRKIDDVIFEEVAVTEILKAANDLSGTFTDVVPLVDRGSIRLKIARLSVSLAARTFSEHEGRIVVRKCHVQFIRNWLDRVYSSDVFGYRDFSEAYSLTRKLKDTDEVKKRVLGTPFPSDFINQMIYATTIDLRDIADWCGWDRGEANELLSFLVRKHALMRDNRVYRKSPDFIDMLKILRGSKELEMIDRPGFVTDTHEEM